MPIHTAMRCQCAPPAAQSARHCAQQQNPHVRRQTATLSARPAVARVAHRTTELPTYTPARGGNHPLLPLERGYCAASSLGLDKPDKEKQEYYTNMGAAIRALQQDLPAVLERQPDLNVCCEGVVFEDNLSPRLGLPASSCAGQEAYSRLLWSLRFHSTLFFCKSRVEVQRMWEREPGVLCVRWSAAACPRLLSGLLATSSTMMSLDGVSEFHFNDQGRIMKHSVDCVSYSGPRAAQPLLALRRQRGALVPGLAGGSFDD